MKSDIRNIIQGQAESTLTHGIECPEDLLESIKEVILDWLEKHCSRVQVEQFERDWDE